MPDLVQGISQGVITELLSAVKIRDQVTLGQRMKLQLGHLVQARHLGIQPPASLLAEVDLQLQLQRHAAMQGFTGRVTQAIAHPAIEVIHAITKLGVNRANFKEPLTGIGHNRGTEHQQAQCEAPSRNLP